MHVILTFAMTSVRTVQKRTSNKGYQNTATTTQNMTYCYTKEQHQWTIHLRMHLGASKYFKAPKCIQSQETWQYIRLVQIKCQDRSLTVSPYMLPTATRKNDINEQSVFECVWVLQRTSKHLNAFEVKKHDNPWQTYCYTKERLWWTTWQSIGT